jgi:hypothetical protein
MSRTCSVKKQHVSRSQPEVQRPAETGRAQMEEEIGKDRGRIVRYVLTVWLRHFSRTPSRASKARETNTQSRAKVVLASCPFVYDIIAPLLPSRMSLLQAETRLMLSVFGDNRAPLISHKRERHDWKGAIAKEVVLGRCINMSLTNLATLVAMSEARRSICRARCDYVYIQVAFEYLSGCQQAFEKRSCRAEGMA